MVINASNLLTTGTLESIEIYENKIAQRRSDISILRMSSVSSFSASRDSRGPVFDLLSYLNIESKLCFTGTTTVRKIRP